MHMLRTSKWSTPVRRAMLLAGLAVVLVVALPATASGSKAGPTAAKGAANGCADGSVVLKSFSPKQGVTDTWVFIKGKHLNGVDLVWVFYGEGYSTVSFWHFGSNYIGFYIPGWAETGRLGIEDIGCSSDWSQKKLVIN